MPGRARLQLRAAAAALCAIFSIACSRSVEKAPAAVDERTAASVFTRPHAAVQPSRTPLWFEFGPSGPAPISGPLDSSLTPFEPWPLARRGAGLVVSERSCSVAANRDGFLCLVRRGDGGIALYRAAGPAEFASYSVAAAFAYGGAPTALLYRDRFFVDPVDPAPEPRAFSVAAGSAELLPADIPLLSAYPASESWDIESLSAAADGRIFLRAAREGAVSYAAAPALDGERAEVSAGAYRAAQLPRPPSAAALPLRMVLEAAANDAAAGNAKVATAWGKGRTFPETYLAALPTAGNAEAALAASEGEVERLWAYYDEERALVLFPDGRYYAAAAAGPTVSGALPALPEGFAYTGIALLGRTAVALWEEQDGWAVGSAGLLLVDVFE
jgi:hypothetical protein